MLRSKKNYISKLKIPNTNTLVIFNGIYQSDLSDQHEGLVINQQTLKLTNSKLEKPIHLLFLNSKNSEHTFSIIAEENSHVTLIEEHDSLKQNAYSNNIKINILAKNSSEIIYYKLQTENNNTIHNAQTEITLKQNSKFVSNFIGKGAKTSHDILHVKLTEEHSNYDALGIISLHNTQTLNYQMHIEHLVPNCTSNLLFKGIIDDKATGTFDCLVTAHPNAIKTETHVTNKNLLLSETATMNTSPQLEIYADDVICTHGATVGQLDQEALFYLRSRGLAENSAIQLLTAAFTQEIVDKFASFCKQKISQGAVYEQ